jgi:ethanolamine permease
MAFNAIFIILNIYGVKESATFSVFITILAVIELLLFMGVVGPHFKMANFLTDAMPFGWSGVFAALPFAVWFYLAIEGVAMVAEEVDNPKRNIPRGYILCFRYAVILAFGVMILTGGVADWHKLSSIAYPLPEAISLVLGKGSGLTQLFASIGLFGLIASIHGTIIASSRQVYAMARSGYLPRPLASVSQRFKTPHWAIIAGGVISFAALYIYQKQLDQIIILSVLGAVTMYMMSMISLFVIRHKEPKLERPFAAIFYPVFPAIALLISVICLVAIVYYNLQLSLVFFAGLAIALVIFMLMGKHKTKIMDDEMLDASLR